MTITATLILLFILIVRPQEIWPVLDSFRLLDVFTGLSLLGVLLDIGREKHRWTPQIPFVLAFIANAYLSTAILKGREAFVITTGFIQLVFYFVFLYGPARFSRLKKTLVLLLALGGFVAAVAVHQGYQEPQCLQITEDESTGDRNLDPSTADGRPCERVRTCEQDRWEFDWGCERVGLFGTVSTGHRVRYRGQLGDPNELAVFLGAVLPFLFGIGISWKKKVTSIASLVLVALALFAVVLSKSRGGQLVIGTVFGVYFVSAFGWKKGLLAAVAFAAPVVLLGGRESDEAEASANERTELLYYGFKAFQSHPIFGVGKDEFKEYVDLRQTAHNSYLLAATELGFPGLFFFTGILWSSFKIPLTVLKKPPLNLSEESKALIMPLAKSLMASYMGMSIGIFFLSFAYKQLLYVWFGLAGAFYLIVKREDPEFEVKIGFKDYAYLFVADLFILGFIILYSRTKM